MVGFFASGLSQVSGVELLDSRILMGLTDLFEVSSALTEKLRGMDMSGYEPYFEEVQRVYHRVSGMLQQYITEKNGKQV